jgi:beta-galactosidase
MLGGFIWEWCDQGLHQKTADGKMFTALGGDFGDVPNHGGFCIKGLVSAERGIPPKYWEVKKVYQPVAIEPVKLKPGKVVVKVTNRNSFLNLNEYTARWSVTSSDGEQIQSGVLNPVDCAPGKASDVKIPVGRIHELKPGTEFWLRLSFHTRTDLPWAKAGYEIAWQQMQLKAEGLRGRLPRQSADKQRLKLIQHGDVVKIEGTNFGARFSRAAGTLISLNFGRREMLATNELAGPVLQLFRAPTDNDKGFGKWLARDWREAGLTNLIRRVDAFEITETKSSEVKIKTVVTSSGTSGGCKWTTAWTIHGDGSLDMDNRFEPFGTLPLLPRIGVVMQIAKNFENVRWLGRGPWENYSDRKESADLGVWSGPVSNQYVPYVRPQENGNKEDVRWLTLADENGEGLKIVAETNPFSFSALHFTANDLTSARHNYELHPRPEIILSLDSKMGGLGNSSCGPGVLERHAVSPAESYRLRLRFEPCRQ